MSLSAKQEQFCLEYIKDLNATQAAIRAGYSDVTPRQAGAQLLSNPNIADRIAELCAERARETKIDAAWVLKRLAAEAEADMADLYDDNGNLKPIHEWPLVFRQGLVGGIKMDRVKREVSTKTIGESHDDRVIEITEEETRIVEVKLDSRVKRLELIGRHIGVRAFSDQLALVNPGGGPVKISLVAATAEDPAKARKADGNDEGENKEP